MNDVLSVVCVTVVLVVAALVPANAQDSSAGRVWGIGVAIIPATSFNLGDFSLPTFTISLRYWSDNNFGVEGDFTFGIKRTSEQTPSVRFTTTVQVKGLYKFANTQETDFYLSSGVVARYRSDRFSLPAFRTDVGAEFNANPNVATSWEVGYGFRLLGEGDFLDRITTGIGWGRHFYPGRTDFGGAL